MDVHLTIEAVDYSSSSGRNSPSVNLLDQVARQKSSQQGSSPATAYILRELSFRRGNIDPKFGTSIPERQEDILRSIPSRPTMPLAIEKGSQDYTASNSPSTTSRSMDGSPLTSTASKRSWSAGFTEDDAEMPNASDQENEDDPLLLPKVEEEDEEDRDIAALRDACTSVVTPTRQRDSASPKQVKRPRGRPRKNPILKTDSMSKVAKGRSKTGCLTCRKRKKKCDEAKPRCMNCDKNAVVCEGYPEKTVWKSGKERAAEEAQTYRITIPSITLQPVIHGVETPGDRMFLEHYVFRLSTIFTVEGAANNAFKNMLLPMAVKHLGLMHSILALSSKHINYHQPYGRALLQKHPEVDEMSLIKRSEFHHDQAMEKLHEDIAKQQNGKIESSVISARFGQMLCLVLETLVHSDTPGAHRVHLHAYQRLIADSPPEEGPFLEFIQEFFQYHICADELISLPQGSSRLGGITGDFVLPKGVVQPEAVRLLGVQDGLFFHMSKITNIRNTIRDRMEAGLNPTVDYESLYLASEIDAGIRSWTPPWPPGDSRDLAGLVYKQMMWVYLYRTLYPPSTASWTPDARIVEPVNDGLKMLAQFKDDDPSQTVLLAPTFIIGCAAFKQQQRDPIRKSIRTIKEYMGLVNADKALAVLEEVWKLMDAKDERSWDWQRIAQRMGMDFLAT